MHEGRLTKGSITFGAVGDVCLCGKGDRQLMQNGPDWPFEKMMPHFRQADLLFGNLESVVLPPDFPDEEIDPKGLASKFDGTAALKHAGFDFLNLAQNHILDGGTLGMFHTQKVVEKLGIATGGIGQTQEEARRMQVLEVGGLRFGFLCYAEDTNATFGTLGPCHAYYDRKTVLEDIRAHRDTVDVLVVSVHADLEYMETPSVWRRDDFREFARAGATMVLGHHPHVPQGVELLDGSLLAYSLGNCYFFVHRSFMRVHRPHTARSFLLLVQVSKEGVTSFSRIPFEIPEPPNMRPLPFVGPDSQRMHAHLDQLDEKCRDDRLVAENWRKAALQRLEKYLYTSRQLRISRGGWPERVLNGIDKFLMRRSKIDVYRALSWLLPSLLVAENQAWVREIISIVEERWAGQRGSVDPHHRPYYNPSCIQR